MQSKCKTSIISCDNELYHYMKMIDFFQNQMKDPEKAEINWDCKCQPVATGITLSCPKP